jgi:hypothetical protein
MILMEKPKYSKKNSSQFDVSAANSTRTNWYQIGTSVIISCD